MRSLSVSAQQAFLRMALLDLLEWDEAVARRSRAAAAAQQLLQLNPGNPSAEKVFSRRGEHLLEAIGERRRRQMAIQILQGSVGVQENGETVDDHDEEDFG